MRHVFIRHLIDAAYLLAVGLMLPWIVWSMVVHGKYREGFAAKLLGRVPVRPADKRACIWLHAVSVGEVNVLQTLVARLESQWPDARLFVSTTTKTGFDHACQRFARHTVFYCPLDFSWAVRRALRRIRPDLLILVELELWPNLIAAAKGGGATVAVINGRLGEKSYRGYRRLRSLISRTLRQVDVIAAQDEAVAERFLRLGAAAGAVHVTGSLKYDGAETDRSNPATLRLRCLASIGTDDVVFIAGSTQAPEERLAIETYRELRQEAPHLRLILVPRHPQRFDEVADLLDRTGLPWVRRSQLEDNGSAFLLRDPDARSISRHPVDGNEDARPLLLVDSVGELAAWWGMADIAFVGGSFGHRGGQNMIEPAAFGAAVCFGPSTRNFREIVQTMLSAEAACVVQDPEELTAFVRRCLTDQAWALELGLRAQKLVSKQLGAAERTLELLEPFLKTKTPGRSSCSAA